MSKNKETKGAAVVTEEQQGETDLLSRILDPGSKLATPRASEARASLASRPAQENRPTYSRAGGYRR